MAFAARSKSTLWTFFLLLTQWRVSIVFFLLFHFFLSFFLFFFFFFFFFFSSEFLKSVAIEFTEKKKGERKQANCNAIVQNGRECTCHFTAVDCTVVVVVVAVDRFYKALFSALEQTHCARM